MVLYTTYEKTEADNIRVILEEKRIDHKINLGKGNMETALGVSNSRQYEIIVKKEDYNSAKVLIEEILEKNTADVDFSKYTDDELRDIIINSQDWHVTFVDEAAKIAKMRGIKITRENIERNEQDKQDEIIKNAKTEAYKEARGVLFSVAGINLIIPIIILVFGDGIKIVNLFFYLLSAGLYFGLAVWAKRKPLQASVIGFVFVLVAFTLTYIGDSSMIKRYLYLKISIVSGFIYAIIKSINIKKSGS